MTQTMKEAYAEVDLILGMMDEKYVNEIPKKLREKFKQNKAAGYKKEIKPQVLLNEQNLKNETLVLLAILNYKFWCKDEKRKKELLNIYQENEKKYNKEKETKYNPNNIFA